MQNSKIWETLPFVSHFQFSPPRRCCQLGLSCAGCVRPHGPPSPRPPTHAMPLSQLELDRLQRIAANKKRMEQIGLTTTVQQIAAATVQERAASRRQRSAGAAARKAVKTASAGRVRR